MRQRRLFLIRFFAAIAAFSFLSVNLLFPRPTYAFLSSLDTPAGAEIAALESSYVAAPTAASETAASASIGSATSSGSYVGKGFAGVTAAGLAIAGLTAAGVNNLQDLAAQRYCSDSANAKATVCGYFATGYIWSSITTTTNTSGTVTSYSGIGQDGATCTPFGNYSNSFNPLTQQLSQVYNSGHNPVTSCVGISVVPKGFVLGSIMPWSSWDSSSRSAAVNLLTGDDYKNNLSESSPVAIPNSSDSTLNISGSNLAGTFYQDSSGAWHYVSGSLATIPNPTPSPTPSLSPSPSPSLSPSPSPTPSPSLSPSPSPSPSPLPNPSPSPSPSPTPPDNKKDCYYTIDENHLFYPDVRNDRITGFHSTARARKEEEEDSGDYYWITEPAEYEADYEPFTAEFGIPQRSSLGTKTSSFFPILLNDSVVLNIIGEAYIKSGCPAYGIWSASVQNPLIPGESIIIEGSVKNHRITTAYPYAPGVSND